MKYYIEYLAIDQWVDVSDSVGYISINDASVDLGKARAYCIEHTRGKENALRIVVETEAEWDGDPADEDTEATDWEYETYAVYVNGTEYFPNPSPVTVYVRGGYVQNVECPDWLDVDVQDYDANPELDPLTYIEVLNDDE